MEKRIIGHEITHAVPAWLFGEWQLPDNIAHKQWYVTWVLYCVMACLNAVWGLLPLVEVWCCCCVLASWLPLIGYVFVVLERAVGLSVVIDVVGFTLDSACWLYRACMWLLWILVVGFTLFVLWWLLASACMHKMSGSNAGSTSSKMEKRKITLTAKALASKIESIQKQRKGEVNKLKSQILSLKVKLFHKLKHSLMFCYDCLKMPLHCTNLWCL